MLLIISAACNYEIAVTVNLIHPKAKLYLQTAPTIDNWNSSIGLWLLVPVGAMPLVPGSLLGSKHNQKYLQEERILKQPSTFSYHSQCPTIPQKLEKHCNCFMLQPLGCVSVSHICLISKNSRLIISICIPLSSLSSPSPESPFNSAELL